jgi:asparagine synthase (glutamine-hydrolysing)
MCGIAGELSFGGQPADRTAVRRMTTAVEDRGPDGHGEWSNDWVALGHRRLTIIDLTDAGAQPMLDGDLALVFNGCIYNHEELRRELSPHFAFRSTSDTEVILKAYRRWGEDFVDHLVGTFAVVLVDEQEQKVVIARDRLGIKPLYLAEVGGRLRFASTLPALLAGGGVDTSLDPVALHQYLQWHSIVPAPRTILRHVSKLPAGTIRVVERSGSVRERVYWQPEYVRRDERSEWSEADWREAVHDSLLTAVRRRLVADVPVGVLLSGGLDSSLIVALLAELQGEGVPTFSIGFDDGDGGAGNEFPCSDLVAQTFGTDHHRLHVSTADLVPAVQETVAMMTEPMASHDVTAFFLLSREVAQHVKVVQSGQGADEVFAGYRYHQEVSGSSRSGVVDAFSAAFSDRTRDALAAVVEPDWLLSHDVSRDLLEDRLGAPGAETALDAVLRLDTHLLMVDDPVKRVDNMTMASGLEARVPFLDQDLVELAASCPPSLKASDGGKAILKDLARELLPSQIIDRPKGYFPVPALSHLEEPMLGVIRDTLNAPEARERGVFRQDYLDSLLSAPNERHTPTGGNELWQVALLELWLQTHGVN